MSGSRDGDFGNGMYQTPGGGVDARELEELMGLAKFSAYHPELVHLWSEDKDRDKDRIVENPALQQHLLGNTDLVSEVVGDVASSQEAGKTEETWRQFLARQGMKALGLRKIDQITAQGRTPDRVMDRTMCNEVKAWLDNDVWKDIGLGKFLVPTGLGDMATKSVAVGALTTSVAQIVNLAVHKDQLPNVVNAAQKTRDMLGAVTAISTAAAPLALYLTAKVADYAYYQKLEQQIRNDLAQDPAVLTRRIENFIKRIKIQEELNKNPLLMPTSAGLGAAAAVALGITAEVTGVSYIPTVLLAPGVMTLAKHAGLDNFVVDGTSSAERYIRENTTIDGIGQGIV